MLKPGGRRHFVLAACLSAAILNIQVLAGDQTLSAPLPMTKPQLLNSYLPASMHVLAHLTNQMKFEPAVTTTTARTTTTTPVSTTTTSTTTPSPTTTSPSSTTSILQLADPDHTTPSHGPGNFAPAIPPNPDEYKITKGVPSEEVDKELPPPPAQDEIPYYPPNTLLIPGIQQFDQGIPLLPSPYPYQANNPFIIRSPYLAQDQSFPAYLFPANAYYGPKSPAHFLNPNPLYIPNQFAFTPEQEPQFIPQWYFPQGRSIENEEEQNARIDDTITVDIPDISSLPVENENNFKVNPLELDEDELSDENLQYLAPNVREILQGIHDVKKMDDKGNPASSFQSIEDLYDTPAERKDVSDWLRLKKAAPTQSLIQMLLLYDLLSRDAKKQKLNTYNGYSTDLLTDLQETSQGTAGEQMRAVLQRMVARGDCTHDFANNRAKEMVAELEKPDSKLSSEVRYLEPLRFTP